MRSDSGANVNAPHPHPPPDRRNKQETRLAFQPDIRVSICATASISDNAVPPLSPSCRRPALAEINEISITDSILHLMKQQRKTTTFASQTLLRAGSPEVAKRRIGGPIPKNRLIYGSKVHPAKC